MFALNALSPRGRRGLLWSSAKRRRSARCSCSTTSRLQSEILGWQGFKIRLAGACRVRVVLVHGMGRTPLSMLILAARLRRRGLTPVFFGYSVTFESFLGCTERLRRFIDLRMGGSPFIAVGHSLGTVLLRSVYPQLRKPPVACFFIAPPGQACARRARWHHTAFSSSPPGKWASCLRTRNSWMLCQCPIVRPASTPETRSCRTSVAVWNRAKRWNPEREGGNDSRASCHDSQKAAHLCHERADHCRRNRPNGRRDRWLTCRVAPLLHVGP